MMTVPGSRSVLRCERGAAAMIAAIGMVFLAVVALSFVSLAQLETRIGVNHAQEVRAVQAAEAGARRVFREIYDGGGSAASWLTKTQPIHNDVAIDASGLARYTVRVIDNNDGDSNLNADADNLVLIEATGRSGTPGAEHRVALMVTGGGGPTDAVRVPNNLTLSGNPKIQGQCGSVHVPVSAGYTGLNLDSAGNAVIAQGASTSGTSVAGDYYKGTTATPPQVPPETEVLARPVPPINPAAFSKYADYLLMDNGWAYTRGVAPVDPATLAHCTTDPCNSPHPTGWVPVDSDPGAPGLQSTWQSGKCSLGWKMASQVSSSGPARWEYCGSPSDNGWQTPGTFFVMGDAVISSDPGTSANPLKITIIATASIMVSGNPNLTWDQLTPTTVPPSLNPLQPTNIMFVAGRDLKLNGNASQTFEGAFLAHEQLDISGNPNLNGFFMAENANAGVGSWPTGDDLVQQSNIGGDPIITYNCLTIPELTTPPAIVGWMAL